MFEEKKKDGNRETDKAIFFNEKLQAGKGLVKVNGSPLALVQPEILRFKVYEPLLILGLDKFSNVDIRVRVTGGGHTSQVYAIRQAIAKSIVAYYQKYVDEHSKNQLKATLLQYDRSLLVADNRRCEPKKFGGPGARARYQYVLVIPVFATTRRDSSLCCMEPCCGSVVFWSILWMCWDWSVGSIESLFEDCSVLRHIIASHAENLRQTHAWLRQSTGEYTC